MEKLHKEYSICFIIKVIGIKKKKKSLMGEDNVFMSRLYSRFGLVLLVFWNRNQLWKVSSNAPSIFLIILVGMLNIY